MMECYDIIISLASNDQQRENLEEARCRLLRILSSFSFSREIWTEPFSLTKQEEKGDKCKKPLYLNQLCFGTTFLSVDELQKELKNIERKMGRSPESKLQGLVPIDLDLLLYDNDRYHLSDWERPYVTALLP